MIDRVQIHVDPMARGVEAKTPAEPADPEQFSGGDCGRYSGILRLPR